MDEIKKKRIRDSRAQQIHILLPRDMNQYNRLYGGQLMEWLDELAAVIARRHSATEVVTAAVNNLEFKAGAYLGDTVLLRGHITYTGRTSMEVRIDSYVEEKGKGERSLINTAYFIMVAVDENNRPVEVPGLIIETEEEKAEWEAAKARKAARSGA